MGLWDKLKAAVKKTKDVLRTDVRDLFKSGEILDEEKLEEFEARLLRTDMGVAATDRILGEIREHHLGRTIVVDDIWGTIKSTLIELLQGEDDVRYDPEDPLSPLNLSESKPTVILVAGVNGVGKTTSIAKLANFLMKQGQSVVLAAADTFRAAGRRTADHVVRTARLRDRAEGERFRPGRRGLRRLRPSRRDRGPTSSSSTRPADCRRTRT